MAIKSSLSSARSAPKGRGRLALFAARVEAAANGETLRDNANLSKLVLALDKREVMRCSQLWNTFAQQAGGATEQERPALRVLPPSQDLPPLP